MAAADYVARLLAGLTPEAAPSGPGSSFADRVIRNPVGTQSLSEQSLTAPTGVFDPILGTVRGTPYTQSGVDARYAQELPMVDLMTNLNMGASSGIVPKGQGIRAFHGSPHDFERFDMSKIGSGEGAQAFGHGLYFAGNEGVARGYRDSVSKQKSVFDLVDKNGNVINLPNASQTKFLRFANTYGADATPKDISVYANKLEGEAKNNIRLENLARANPESFGFSRDELKQLILDANSNMELAASLKNGHSVVERFVPRGNMYEVELRTTPERLLDWDKPLAEQPEAVQRALVNAPDPQRIWGDMTGGQIYESSALVPGQFSDKVKAAQVLKEAGLDGIQYLDQGSRAAGEGTRNYVMFDDKLIDIIRKYGFLPFGISSLMEATGGGDAGK